METTIARSEIIRKLDNLSTLIGNTPLIRLDSVHNDKEVKIYAKAEWIQFGGSTKTRAAYSIIRQAILSGELDENRFLLDAATEKMAIAYATIAARMNIPVKLCIPDSTPQNTINILTTLGAKTQLVNIGSNLEKLREEALKIYNENPDKHYFANQAVNDNYWKAHYYTTAEEILEQTNGEVTHFVSGIGATGTFTGVGKRLKSSNKRLVVVSLYPGDIGLNGNYWGHLETSQNTTFYDNQLIDYDLPVSFKEAEDLANQIAKKEGLVLSPAAAANILGAKKVAEEITMGNIVTILPNY